MIPSYGKGIDEILMRYDPTLTQEPRTFFYQQDHEGSVTRLVSGNGDIIEKYRYDVFGNPLILAPNNTQRTASIVSNRFMFTGREFSSLFGFYEYRARAYNPLLGRFMSEDPKLFVHRAGLGTSPTDWTFAARPEEAEFNLFRYCENDPIDFTDPMGLEFNGDLDAKEVERIEGNRFGITGVRVDVVPVELKNDNYTLRLDVTVVRREVAEKVKWHGREIKRTQAQMKVTAEEHEKREHNKDWKGFHDAHQSDVSNTRFSSKEAAQAAARTAEKQKRANADKANIQFEKHEPKERWNEIMIRERP